MFIFYFFYQDYFCNYFNYFCSFLPPCRAVSFYPCLVSVFSLFPPPPPLASVLNGSFYAGLICETESTYCRCWNRLNVKHRDSLASCNTCQTQHGIPRNLIFLRKHHTEISSDIFWQFRLHAFIPSLKLALSLNGGMLWIREVFKLCPHAPDKESHVRKGKHTS